MGLRLKDDFEVRHDEVTGETIFENLNTGNTFTFTSSGDIVATGNVDASTYKGNDIDTNGDGKVDSAVSADDTTTVKGNDIDSNADGKVDSADSADLATNSNQYDGLSPADGTSGQILETNGSSASWQNPPSGLNVQSTNWSIGASSGATEFTTVSAPANVVAWISRGVTIAFGRDADELYLDEIQGDGSIVIANESTNSHSGTIYWVTQ